VIEARPEASEVNETFDERRRPVCNISGPAEAWAALEPYMGDTLCFESLGLAHDAMKIGSQKFWRQAVSSL